MTLKWKLIGPDIEIWIINAKHKAWDDFYFHQNWVFLFKIRMLKFILTFSVAFGSAVMHERDPDLSIQMELCNLE